MNYDSYLLGLAYFSGVTVELRAAGSDGSGETKRGAARMRIALLERKKTLKKKKNLHDEEDMKLATRQIHFYVQKVRERKVFGRRAYVHARALVFQL